MAETDAPAHPGSADDTEPIPEECPADLGLLHEAYCLPALLRRRFTHAELWNVLGTLVDEAPGLSREEIGHSAEGRPLYAVRFGSGPVKVLLWSQMHGDEPTHTMGLADLFTYFGREPDDPRVGGLAAALTVVAVPMLNPDGAERFRRPNAQGVDPNRDARAWTTPEMRALRDLLARERAEFAFDLHDHDVRHRVGTSDRLTALALLASPIDGEGGDDEVRLRAKRLCGAVRAAIEPLVGERVARYSDEWDERQIGQYVQRSGTSTVLLEVGFWPDDPEKQFLRRISFVALLAGLEAIARGEVDAVPLERYESLAETSGDDVYDLLVRGGTVVVPGLEPFRADVGVRFAAPLDLRDGTVAEVGDLADATAREVLDATGLFVHPELEALGGSGDGPLVLGRGLPASFQLRREADPASETVLTVRDGLVVGEDGVGDGPDTAAAEARDGNHGTGVDDGR